MYMAGKDVPGTKTQFYMVCDAETGQKLSLCVAKEESL